MSPRLPASLLLSVLLVAGAPPRAQAAEETEKKEESPAALPPGQAAAVATKRAVAAMKAQNWKAARTAWEEVLTLDPQNPAVLSNLGKVCYQLRDLPAAVENLEKAVARKSGLIDSWITLGLLYEELGKPMMAVSCMTRAVAENPADPRSHNSLAIVLKRIGWTTGAESELQKALDLAPEYGEAHFNLAVMYLERKPPSLEMARRHYDRALALGAAADSIVETQLRGESAIEETTAGEAEEPAAEPATPAAAAAAPPSPPASKAPAQKDPPRPKRKP